METLLRRLYFKVRARRLKKAREAHTSEEKIAQYHATELFKLVEQYDEHAQCKCVRLWWHNTNSNQISIEVEDKTITADLGGYYEN